MNTVDMSGPSVDQAAYKARALLGAAIERNRQVRVKLHGTDFFVLGSKEEAREVNRKSNGAIPYHDGQDTIWIG
jgi:hypothetical protein